MPHETTFDILYAYVHRHSLETTDSLLEEWASKVISTGDYGFERGLLGLGWLIAYLIENGYVEGDADDILEDIDDSIYKLTIKEVLDHTVNIAQTLYYVTYYQQRLQYVSGAHFYRRFTHFECIKLLLEKLNTFLLQQQDSITKDNIKDITDIVLKYSYLTKSCVNEKLVEEAFYPTVEKLIAFFASAENRQGTEESFIKLYVTVRQYDNPYWESKLEAKALVNTTETPWVELACQDNWLQGDILKIVEAQENKIFLYQMVTNIKTKDRSI